MKVGTLVATVGIAGSLLLAGCGDDSGGGGGLNVKGMYLGMKITEAQTVCMKLFEGLDFESEKRSGDNSNNSWVKVKGELPIHEVETGSQFSFILIGAAKWGEVNADKNGNVYRYYFTGPVVRHIFGFTKMQTSDFVQQFANSYKIPQFNISDNFEYWYYDSPHGYRVRINEDKSLIVEKIAIAKFD